MPSGKKTVGIINGIQLLRASLALLVQSAASGQALAFVEVNVIAPTRIVVWFALVFFILLCIVDVSASVIPAMRCATVKSI